MTVSTFGDWEPDDAWDVEPADPEQVERRRDLLRRRRFSPDQVATLIADWLARQGADR